jgi:hypothetical protein
MLAYTKDEGTLAEVFADEKGGGISESCHNYGAVPVYFLSSYVLGVRRSAPVWKKELLINPRIGDLQYARGKVVTQFGVIGMDWQREENGKKLVVKVTGPNDIKYVWKIPNLGIKTDVFLNGKPIEVAEKD